MSNNSRLRSKRLFSGSHAFAKQTLGQPGLRQQAGLDAPKPALRPVVGQQGRVVRTLTRNGLGMDRPTAGTEVGTMARWRSAMARRTQKQ